MTSVTELQKERRVLEDAITDAYLYNEDPNPLIIKLKDIIDEIVEKQVEVDKKQKGDCLFE